MIDNTATYLFILFLLSLRCFFKPPGGVIPPKYDRLINRADNWAPGMRKSGTPIKGLYCEGDAQPKPSSAVVGGWLCPTSAKQRHSFSAEYSLQHHSILNPQLYRCLLMSNPNHCSEIENRRQLSGAICAQSLRVASDTIKSLLENS